MCHIFVPPPSACFREKYIQPSGRAECIIHGKCLLHFLHWTLRLFFNVTLEWVVCLHSQICMESIQNLKQDDEETYRVSVPKPTFSRKGMRFSDADLTWKNFLFQRILSSSIFNRQAVWWWDLARFQVQRPPVTIWAVACRIRCRN